MGFKLPTLNELSRDPGRTLGNAIGEAYSDPLGTAASLGAQGVKTMLYDLPATAYSLIEQPLADVFGFESSSDRAARNAENARRAEAAARLKHYTDSLSADIDAATKSQIEALYNNGSSSTVIAEYLQNAKDGKGIFGVRKTQDNQIKKYREAPGRGQTVFSTGAPTVLGGGRGY